MNNTIIEQPRTLQPMLWYVTLTYLAGLHSHIETETVPAPTSAIAEHLVLRGAALPENAHHIDCQATLMQA